MTGKADYVALSPGPEVTFRLGKILGETLSAGDIVALIGDLGSGKTCLTQGIARGLGVSDKYQVTSPTFTLVNEYPGRLTLYHVDVYRLEGAVDLEDMGCDEFLYGGGVTVIEWAEKIRDLLPVDAYVVTMTYLDEFDRKIEITGGEEKMARLVEAIKDGGL
jgi:tRNA threonylcarbamoyladenosine biosynthesis protein TsaE